MHDFRIDRQRFEAPVRDVGAICDAFEAAWLAGQEPRIEDFVLRGDGSHRVGLLRELLLAVWDWYRRHRRQPQLESYLAHFFFR